MAGFEAVCDRARVGAPTLEAGGSGATTPVSVSFAKDSAGTTPDAPSHDAKGWAAAHCDLASIGAIGMWGNQVGNACTAYPRARSSCMAAQSAAGRPLRHDGGAWTVGENPAILRRSARSHAPRADWPTATTARLAWRTDDWSRSSKDVASHHPRWHQLLTLSWPRHCAPMQRRRSTRRAFQKVLASAPCVATDTAKCAVGCRAAHSSVRSFSALVMHVCSPASPSPSRHPAE
mmetsp:Transcript_24367/g.92044  ORF Transcript_24367/g.92044 Transcript_24367/m.92044 type:complete len:233 (-) Transcript_24367:671-1369(-)